MKYLITILIILSFTKTSSAQNSSLHRFKSLKEQSINFNKKTARYLMRYYYEEAPEKMVFTRLVSRENNASGASCQLDYDPNNKEVLISRSCYDEQGIPVGFGTIKDFTSVFKDSLILNFQGKDTTILIKSNILRNPTVLWFWKHQPKVNDAVVVAGVRRNFISRKVDQVEISYVYLGKSKIRIMGKEWSCHLVRSKALNAGEDVYDERWYDKNGMLLRERHVVGKDGVRIGELIQILE